MATDREPYWPSIWEVVRIVAVLVVLIVINVVTRNDVITAFAAIFLFGAIVARHFVRTWRGLI